MSSINHRVQMTTLVIHTIAIPLFLSAFFAAFAIPGLRTALLIYIGFMVFDPRAERGASLSPFQRLCRRAWWWNGFAGYFPVTLHRSVPLKPCFEVAPMRKRAWIHWWYKLVVWWLIPFSHRSHTAKPTGQRYIFGYHPHGIIGMGAVGGLATEGAGWSKLFPGIPIRLLTLTSNFWFPFYREYILSIGISSVSKKSCLRLLKNNQPICILLGGARESLLARPSPGPMNLIINSRFGFVKIALETGASLVPVLGFGEKDIYNQMAADSPFHLLMTKYFGFTIPLFFGRGIFNKSAGILPHRKPIDIVVGEPIQVPLMKNPDRDTIVRIHKQYVDALKSLYEQHHPKYAPNEPLVIVE